MNFWMTIWTTVLAGGVIGFLGLLLVVGGGAVRELKMTLEELREDTQESAEHPETLDKAI